MSAVGLALTGAVELALAVLTGSVALLADALHNLSDVSTSAVVFLGFRVSKRPPSATHPYGYERAEDLAGLGIALVIWASAVFAGVESYRKLVGHAPTSHLAAGIAGAALGIVGNQLVARYKRTIGRRIHSATLVAEARHSWLDAIPSLGALVGLVLVAFGLRWGDPVAGFAVTVFICHVGYQVTSQIVHHLMDGVDPAVLEQARTAATTVPGVQAVVVRGRWMGRSLLVEVEAQVPAALPVGQAAQLGRQVETRRAGRHPRRPTGALAGPANREDLRARDAWQPGGGPWLTRSSWLPGTAWLRDSRACCASPPDVAREQPNQPTRQRQHGGRSE